MGHRRRHPDRRGLRRRPQNRSRCVSATYWRMVRALFIERLQLRDCCRLPMGNRRRRPTRGATSTATARAISPSGVPAPQSGTCGFRRRDTRAGPCINGAWPATSRSSRTSTGTGKPISWCGVRTAPCGTCALSSSGYTSWTSYQWGIAGDVPLVADFDGDGKTDLAVWRPITATWYVRFSSSHYAAWTSFQWGVNGDVPIQADFDGDGRTDLTVWRPEGRHLVPSVLVGGKQRRRLVRYQWGAFGDDPM